MANPLLKNLINPSNGNNANPIMALMQQIKMIQNPQAMVNQMMAQNPNAQALMTQMQQSGMSPKQYAMQLMKNQGIDPNMLISVANQMGIKL